MKNKNFFKSFAHAADGIMASLREERNLRFHTAVGILVCVFASFYGTERIEWAILLVTIALVIFAELVNTAIERTADAVTEEYNRYVKLAKDAAAGAVLVTALAAVGVGICLFGDLGRIADTINGILQSPFKISVCMAALLLCFLILTIEKRKVNNEK